MKCGKVNGYVKHQNGKKIHPQELKSTLNGELILSESQPRSQDLKYTSMKHFMTWLKREMVSTYEYIIDEVALLKPYVCKQLSIPDEVLTKNIIFLVIILDLTIALQRMISECCSLLDRVCFNNC